MNKRSTKFKTPTSSISHKRIYFLELFGILFVLTLIGRLFYWQVMQHNTLTAQAQNQYVYKINTQAARGKILDSNGIPIATNVLYYEVAVAPKEVKDARGFSVKVAPFVHKSPEQIQKQMEQNPDYLILDRRMEKKNFEELNKLKIEELISSETEGRYYPEGEKTAHLLGFVNHEGQGQYSMEQYFDGLLSGKEGVESLEVDPLRVPIPLGNREVVEAEEGATITTTIDLTLQEKLYDLLKESAIKFKATKGVIIVMNPNTGEIPAMVSYPSYDPNSYSQYFENNTTELLVNPNIQQFEPGSIFKIVTMSSGIDSGSVSANTTITDKGKIEIDGYTIHNANGKAYGQTNMTDVLKWSTNVGASYVAQQMGRDVFYKYIQNYGFGKTTGISLIGESNGLVYKPEDWANLDLASIGFGQAIATTPVQLVAAVSAVANGGNYFKPMLVKSITQNGKENKQLPRLMRRVIKPETASTLTNMLKQVVTKGFGNMAAIPGYSVAGKNGTAQVAKPGGGYEEYKVVGSFIGYAPADNPQFVLLVSFHLDESIIDRERWGAYTAAPTFAKAGKIIPDHYQIPPN